MTVTVPAAGPFDSPLRSLTVNEDWIEAVVGILLLGYDAAYWQGTDSEIEHALDAIAQIIEELGD